MRRGLTAGFLIVAIVATTTTSQTEDAARVWVWSARCRTPTRVAIRLRLDGRTVYSASLPVCRWDRTHEDGTARFRFTPSRRLVWYGYRSDEGDGTTDPGDPTPAGAALDVDLWQAGGEPDVILLGFTIAAGNDLHMNSLHFLSPTEDRMSTMAPGLVLETRPEPKR